MGKKIKALLLAVLLAGIAVPPSHGSAESGASFFLGPAHSEVSVGDTFSVSVYLNTGGHSINAVEAHLEFPPDKLQVVSPSVGKSLIEVWVGQPAFSNSEGTINYIGTIPSPGVNTSRGIISTISFRVKATGQAFLRFSDKSRVLLNDGKGTDILNQTSGGVYTLTVPPPQGPIVTSTTHPDQSRWYLAADTLLHWSPLDNTDEYSYVLDKEPVTVPDDIPEPNNSNQVSYKGLSSGVYYFHIKGHAQNVWGGVTHYVLNIDKNAPAKFRIEIDPSRETTSKRPVIRFFTTDEHSGVDHYEIKLIPLSLPSAEAADTRVPQEFFIESESPYVPELEPGKYDVLVRAYDVAGNFRESAETLSIYTAPAFAIAMATPSTPIGFFFFLLLFLVVLYIWRRLRKWHKHVDEIHVVGATGAASVKSQLELLKEYQKKYGHLAIVLSLLASFAGIPTEASTVIPPYITTISYDISNTDIFYAAGKSMGPEQTVVLYLQNLEQGETQSFRIIPDRKGDWFYAHTSFLSVGEYAAWTQGIEGDIESPPSAQETFEVHKQGIGLGASRLSYETIFQGISLLLLLIVIGLIVHALYHHRHARKKALMIDTEIEEALDSVKRGFATLRHDITKELAAIQRIKTTPDFKQEEEIRESELMSDLERIEQHIGKEVWDVRRIR